MVKRSRGSGDTPKRKQQGKKQMQAGSTDESSSDARSPRVDPRVQREIGRHLRAHYDDLVNEPVPDKFIELLQQLERSVRKE